MKVVKLNIIFRFVDFLLSPFMWVLGGFTLPLQETHVWHMKKWDWKKDKGLIVKGYDKKALFGHDDPLGLYHMSIFGGLTKYVVIEASGFENCWFVGWARQIHALPVKENRIKLLVGKGGFTAYGIGDNHKQLKLKVVGFGELGDKKYNGLRLF